MARITAGPASGEASSVLSRPAPNASLPARDVHAHEVDQLTPAVYESAEGSARRAMVEIDLDLHHAPSGARGVDRHPDLHAEPVGEREHLLEHTRPQGPLSRDRRPQL